MNRITFSLLVVAIIAFRPAFLVAEVVLESKDFGEAQGWEYSHPAYVSQHDATFEIKRELADDQSVIEYASFKSPSKPFHFCINYVLPLKPQWKSLRVTVRVRSPEFTKGDAAWKTPGLIAQFRGELDGPKESYGPAPRLTEPSEEWQTLTTTMEIPKWADSLKLSPGLWFCTGEFDIDSMKVEAF